MRRFELQVFANRCANCDFEFESLHLWGDYQPVVYVNAAGAMQYIDSDEDPVWTEVSALIKAAAKGRRLTEMDEAEVFHQFLATTTDPPAAGGALISAWAEQPCSRCRSTQRARFGPVDPPRFREVTIPAVTHKRWHAMSSEVKIAEAKQAVAEWVRPKAKPMPVIVADFDAIADAIAADPRPDVLTLAERFLLRHIPAHARRALDVGCGDGTLTRALAARGIATLGIDASPRMIALARARAGGSPLLEYRIGDVMTDAPPAAAFDLVVSVAMAHHAPLDRLVKCLVAAVAPGGTLLIQDVTTRRGIRHLPVNALAWFARHLRVLPSTGRGRPTVAAFYTAHGVGEEYLHQSEVADVYRTILPGARVYHHLEWRYTAVWHREAVL